MLARAVAVLASCALLAAPLSAGSIVRVTVEGEVAFNQVAAGALGTVNTGDHATMTFTVDSDVFVDNGTFPTRGYAIDNASWGIEFPTFTMPLQSPFPAGQTPYFVLRDNDPAVDGFLVSTNTGFPVGVPVQQEGVFGKFVNNFYVTYGGSELSSLDILDALGTYDFTGLTVFNWVFEDGGFEPFGIDFESMTLELDAPWTDLGGGTVGVAGQPTLEAHGSLVAGTTTTVALSQAPANALMVVWLATAPAPFPALGGTVHAFPYNLQLLRVADAGGSFAQSLPWPAGIPSGVDLTLQFLVQDASSIHGITLSNASRTTTP